MLKIKSAAVIINGETFTGYRHADIRNNIMDTGEFTREEICQTMHDKYATGFILEDGTFLTRGQALLYGRHIGQIGQIEGRELTSEDLWERDGRPIPPEGKNYFFRLSDKSYSAVDKDRRALATMFSPSKRMVPTMLAGRWYWIEDRADVMGFPKWMWLRDLFEWRDRVGNFRKFLEKCTDVRWDIPIYDRDVKSIDNFTYSIFEREGDSDQLYSATYIYLKVMENINEIDPIDIEGYISYNLEQAIGKDLLIVFTEGKETGCLFYDYKENGIGVPTIRFPEKDLSKFNNDFGEFWENNRKTIIHELVHLNDYERIGKIIKSDLGDLKKYFNNPLEFNAFYIEVIDYFYEMYKNETLPDRKEFIGYAWEYVNEIQPELESNLTNNMKTKWNKRFYQLYDELKKEFGE